MAYQDIIFTKEEGIATITLNRADKMNALTVPMAEEILEALEKVSKSSDVNVLVITGAGRGFCAGADVRVLEERLGVRSAVDRREDVRQLQRIVLGLRALEKPTVAAVNGPAVGAGCDLALACDLRIASESARFGQVYIKIGLVPGVAGIYFLPRFVGTARACELIFTGDIIDASKAYEIGLVNKVVPASELQSATKELATRIAHGPPLAMAMAKKAIYKALEMDMEGCLEYLACAATVAMQSEDHAEGLRAFLEKREPHFEGR